MFSEIIELIVILLIVKTTFLTSPSIASFNFLKVKLTEETFFSKGTTTVFVATAGDRPLLKAVNQGGVDGNGLDKFTGFIPATVKQLLSLGKHTMLEEVEGERLDFERHPSEKHKSAREHLMELIVGGVFYDIPEDDDPEDGYHEDLRLTTHELLGEELTRVERTERHVQGSPFDVDYPYGEFISKIANRVALLRT